jgi:hypothetical protein
MMEDVIVIRGLDPRTYPVRRLNAVAAPRRLDARVKPAHDGNRVARLS